MTNDHEGGCAMINDLRMPQTTEALFAPRPFQAGDEKLSKDELRLKDACYSFEGVLTSTILKEGLKSSDEMGKVEGEEADAGSDAYKEIANEQLATYVGNQGLLGLGELMFERIRGIEALRRASEAAGGGVNGRRT